MLHKHVDTQIQHANDLSKQLVLLHQQAGLTLPPNDDNRVDTPNVPLENTTLPALHTKLNQLSDYMHSHTRLLNSLWSQLVGS